MCLLCKNEEEFDHELLDNLKREQPHHEQLVQLRNILEKRWTSVPYTLGEVSLFKAAIDFIQFAPKARIEEFFREVGIIVTKKDRKKGKNGYAIRLMRNYHKEKVQQVFKQYLMYCRSVNSRKEFDELLQGVNIAENITKVIDTFDENVMYWYLSTLEKNQEVVMNAYKQACMKAYVRFLVEAVLTYDHFEFEKVMEHPESLKGTYKSVDHNQMKHENKTLKKKMGKIKKEESQLKQEVYHLHQQTKQLKGELYTLYEQSLEDIERLKSEIERERQLFQLERDYLTSMIEELSQPKNERLQPTMPIDLSGKKICVIGGSRSRYYEEIVQKYNGEIHFVPADDFKKIKGAVSSSDSVFFLTELVSHKHFREAVTAAEENQKPFWYINSKGTTSFERHLQEFMTTSVS